MFAGSFSSCFLAKPQLAVYIAQDHLPLDGNTHSGVGASTSIKNHHIINTINIIDIIILLISKACLKTSLITTMTQLGFIFHVTQNFAELTVNVN